MTKLRDFISVWVMGAIGILLILSGLKLIQFTENLFLYCGIVLLILSVLLYLLPNSNSKVTKIEKSIIKDKN